MPIVMVISNGVAVDMAVVDSAATVAPDGRSILLNGTPLLAAKPGTQFMITPGAQIGWVVSGTALVPPATPAWSKTQLVAYANAKQATIMNGGILVAIGGGVSVECSTDPTSLTLLQCAVTMAGSQPGASFAWVPKTGAPLALTSSQITTIFNAVSAFVQATFATLSGVITAINAGTITAPAQLDSPPAPVPAWPANS